MSARSTWIQGVARFGVVALIAGALVASLPSTPAGGQVGDAPELPVAAQPAPGGAPTRPELGVALADDTLALAVARLQDGLSPGPEVDVDQGRIRVEVLHHGTTAQVTAIVVGLGGSVDGAVPGVLVEGEVPFGSLEALEATSVVDFVRPPLPVSEPVAVEAGSGSPGEELIKTNAAAWQDAGFTGHGVRLGIVDFFGQSGWSAAQTAGEVPAPAGTFCRSFGTTCDVFAGSEVHGVAVAEVVHDMAPDAQVYLATVDSTADLQAAVDYFHGQGVDVITRSLTSAYDGPGDGTGPIAAVIDNAVADGMAWFQSAGNNAGLSGVRSGSYYRWTYSDTDGDGWVNFAPGDETLGFYCGYPNGLRWSDFGEGAGTTDYDLYIFDATATTQVGASFINQGTGAPPIERTTSCVSGVNQAAVWLYAPGTTPTGDVLEFAMNGRALERWQNPYSATGPAADHNSAGAVTVGAIEPWDGTTIADYSSQGPTNDLRFKPDVSAASCVTSSVYNPNCFNGTSAATPVVAGGAALVLDAGFATTPRALRTWLLDNATVDRGAVGTDNVFGRGEFILPAAPAALPDGRIRKGATGAQVGNNIYTSGAGQARTGSAARGGSVTYYVSVQNDAPFAERLRLEGTATDARFRVRYTDPAGTDITGQVTSGTYTTPTLAPRATHKVKVVVTVRSTAPAGATLTGTLRASSTTQPTVNDTVKFVTSRR